ncbi:HD-GYP domain-containing protein [Paenibacillus marinisediminis]
MSDLNGNITAQTVDVSSDFSQRYNAAAHAFKGIFERVQAKQDIPVMEIRQIINSLIQDIDVHSNLLFILKRSEDPSLYMYEHSVSVGTLAYIMAKWMGTPSSERMQVALAGILMDIGKTRLDPKILWESGKLTPSEYEDMKQHTTYGYEQLKHIPGLSQGVALAALQHHEREDGSGYPLGITGAQMHPYSKIVAVIDMYHAMCSERLHQKAESPFLVIDKLIEYGFGKLDPKAVLVFSNAVARLSVGSNVILNDGTVGKVVMLNPYYPTRPMIEVDRTFINLNDQRDRWIDKVMF